MVRFSAILPSVALLAASAMGGSITISPVGGGITLNSGNLSSTVFGNVKPAWGAGSLASVHNVLNAAGIDTDGKVTVLSADTDHGLALMVLIDREVSPGTPALTGHLQMGSTGSGENLSYINSIARGVTVTPGSGGDRNANTSFAWNSNGGDAFAWANLVVGNSVEFHFQRPDGDPGLLDSSTFQFVTWTGSNWSVIGLPSDQALFDGSGGFGFGGRVVPLPSAAVMGALPLLVLSGIRRRRGTR